MGAVPTISLGEGYSKAVPEYLSPRRLDGNIAEDIFEHASKSHRKVSARSDVSTAATEGERQVSSLASCSSSDDEPLVDPRPASFDASIYPYGLFDNLGWRSSFDKKEGYWSGKPCEDIHIRSYGLGSSDPWEAKVVRPRDVWLWIVLWLSGESLADVAPKRFALDGTELPKLQEENAMSCVVM